MFLIIGALVVIGVIYLLLKRHESRMVLIAAGILMCCIAGNPMASLDAFAKSMTNAGLITSVCSCMGFSWCMKYTGCDKHLVVAIGKVLKKMGFLLIPGATLATFVVNIAIPSAAGCSAAVGVIFIPIMMSAGIHPAMAAAAVKSGTYGSMLNPGLVHNAVIAKLAGVQVTDVIANHMLATVVGVIIAAAVLTVLAVVLKENRGFVPEGEAGVDENFGINPLFAIMPLVPVIIPLVVKLLCSKKELMINMKEQEKLYPSKTEIKNLRVLKIIFPIAVTTIVALFVPTAVPLIGMLMFGNLIKEIGSDTSRLFDAAANSIMNAATIFLGLSVGATMTSEAFLNWTTIGIVVGGFLAFALSISGGIFFVKLFNLFSKKKINPLIGATGLSAVPMASRVCNEIATKYDPKNHVLNYCMSSNISGVIGSAVAAGVLISFLG